MMHHLPCSQLGLLSAPWPLQVRPKRHWTSGQHATGGLCSSRATQLVNTLLCLLVRGAFAPGPQLLYQCLLCAPAPLCCHCSLHPALLCTALVQSGAILGRKFQPHESHIPYLLQVKVDFNLYGMGFMRLEKVLFRWAGGPVGGYACGAQVVAGM